MVIHRVPFEGSLVFADEGVAVLVGEIPSSRGSHQLAGTQFAFSVKWGP